MDQKFKLVAPRARLTEDYGDPIEEILFGSGWDRGIRIRSSHTAERLVDLLAVPVVHKGDRKPASVEPQSTPCAHSQDQGRDTLVAGTIKREASVKISKSYSLKEANQEDETEYFRSTTLSNLATELILGIMSHIGDIEDIVSLGLANKRLCSIAQAELRSYFPQYFAPWANENIVCVGDYSAKDDFPPGLFSNTELEALQHEEIATFDEEEAEWRIASLNRLYDFTQPGLSHIQEQPMEVLSWKTWRLRDSSGRPKSVRDPAMDSLIKSCDIYRDYFPTDQPWILRNLTIKQFVRAEAIALKPEFIKGPRIIGLGFGEVLLSRISWTAAALEIDDPTTIRRGIWAGHCFDITTLTRHERKTTGDAEWTDVSDEVVTEIATIWESYFGANWRETLCRIFEA
ncbi:hypothetical protein TGAM01_v205924 [Trichoderma gamsii]|uniref:F-box domain-containing protein n=1 Tax=Trichoderma gamsii TaxID=398673 RepID=A0A2P4ZLS2_9HYPO|nr:hypothetical protein TGAM01_v205924 [Trichoderma gamsii]PON25238.1 hypothetical protein TGAM01_v205924 [Trichoderma gamsii]